MIWRKYLLVLDGLFFLRVGKGLIKGIIREWAETSGARGVSSGVIRCDADQSRDMMVYSVHFDSSHWTGVGFRGFDVKHPGEPVTDFS